jgi:hypothetical protein
VNTVAADIASPVVRTVTNVSSFTEGDMAEQPIEGRGRSEPDDDTEDGHDATGVTATTIRAAFAAARATEVRRPEPPENPDVIPGDADK